MRGLDAILFDLGGTLDGVGGWRDRFHRLFAECGLTALYDEDRRSRAFDHAEAMAKATPEMASAPLADMVRRHVGWQFDALGARDRRQADVVVDSFIRGVERGCAISRGVLATLSDQGYRLGVVSNGCGNAALLCDEYGFGPFVGIVVDSHCVGCAKPAPEIFRRALAQMPADAARTAFVGDSIDRDIEPARALGLRTFWVAHGRRTASPAVDVAIDAIDELPAHLRQTVRSA